MSVTRWILSLTTLKLYQYVLHIEYMLKVVKFLGKLTEFLHFLLPSLWNYIISNSSCDHLQRPREAILMLNIYLQKAANYPKNNSEKSCWWKNILKAAYDQYILGDFLASSTKSSNYTDVRSVSVSFFSIIVISWKQAESLQLKYPNN